VPNAASWKSGAALRGPKGRPQRFPAGDVERGSYDFAEVRRSSRTRPCCSAETGLTIRVFDADRNSKTGTDSANLLIANKKFDAEVASIRDTNADLIWVYYDTDQDGGFDLVLFSTRPDSGVAEKAFRIEGEKVRVDSELASGKLYRSSSLFKDKAAAAGFKALATEFLPANAVQD
jgi:hypothetical protein